VQIAHNAVIGRRCINGRREPQNPHLVIASYAKDQEIAVFNGHVHTTELYEVDGVKYLLLGGGNAEQDPILPGRTSIKVPAGYPPDLYWKGQPPRRSTTTSSLTFNPNSRRRHSSSRSGETNSLIGNHLSSWICLGMVNCRCLSRA